MSRPGTPAPTAGLGPARRFASPACAMARTRRSTGWTVPPGPATLAPSAVVIAASRRCASRVVLIDTSSPVPPAGAARWSPLATVTPSMALWRHPRHQRARVVGVGGLPGRERIVRVVEQGDELVAVAERVGHRRQRLGGERDGGHLGLAGAQPVDLHGTGDPPSPLVGQDGAAARRVAVVRRQGGVRGADEEREPDVVDPADAAVAHDHVDPGDRGGPRHAREDLRAQRRLDELGEARGAVDRKRVPAVGVGSVDEEVGAPVERRRAGGGGERLVAAGGAPALVQRVGPEDQLHRGLGDAVERHLVDAPAVGAGAQQPEPLRGVVGVDDADEVQVDDRGVGQPPRQLAPRRAAVGGGPHPEVGGDPQPTGVAGGGIGEDRAVVQRQQPRPGGAAGIRPVRPAGARRGVEDRGVEVPHGGGAGPAEADVDRAGVRLRRVGVHDDAGDRAGLAGPGVLPGRQAALAAVGRVYRATRPSPQPT